jgi:hypothetical protein
VLVGSVWTGEIALDDGIVTSGFRRPWTTSVLGSSGASRRRRMETAWRAPRSPAVLRPARIG